MSKRYSSIPKHSKCIIGYIRGNMGNPKHEGKPGRVAMKVIAAAVAAADLIRQLLNLTSYHM